MSVLVAVSGLALMASGQVTGSRPKNVATGGSAHIARQPYTAEYKISSVKTLPNGATITHDSTEVRASDSVGRVMTARTEIPVSRDKAMRTHVWVVDPVARTTSSWESPGQAATVTAMDAPGTRTSCPAVDPQQPTVQPQKPVVEDLGAETILEVETRGRRTTWTTPVDTIGNDAPLTHSSEVRTAIAPGFRGLILRGVAEIQNRE
jgi:hypothetical protein